MQQINNYEKNGASLTIFNPSVGYFPLAIMSSFVRSSEITLQLGIAWS